MATEPAILEFLFWLEIKSLAVREDFLAITLVVAKILFCEVVGEIFCEFFSSKFFEDFVKSLAIA